jgi:hypothetical protein
VDIELWTFVVGSMAERKKHHFIPRFYLKYFSNGQDGKTIGIYNIKTEKYIPCGNLRNQAYVDYFYGKDGTVELALGNIERVAAGVVRKIISEEKLPEHHSSEFLILLMFVLFLAVRTEYMAKALDELTDKSIKAIFSKDQRVKDLLENVRIGLSNPGAYSLGLMAQVMPVAFDLECKLLVNRTSCPYITSDNPVVKYNQYLETRQIVGSIVGLAVKGLQILLPLNPFVYLMFYDRDVYRVGGRKHRVVNVIESRDIDELNRLQVVNADSNLFFNEQVSELYVRKIVKDAARFRRKTCANVVEYGPFQEEKGRQSSIIQLFYEDVRTRLRLSFVSITKKARRYDLSTGVVPLRDPDLVDKVAQAREMFIKSIKNKHERSNARDD